MTDTTERAREENMDDLLPCPFCGGEAELKEDLVYHTGEPSGKWWATCPSCDVIRDSGFCVPKAEAIAAWNARAAIAAMPQPTSTIEAGDALPIDMVLFCPNCGLQHIDEPDERTPDWTNPPHRSHLCHDCGCIWRPADVPTNGVGAIQTQGKADTWAPERGNAERALVAGYALREAREALHDGAESLSEALELIEDLDECPVPLKWANALDKMNEALVEGTLCFGPWGRVTPFASASTQPSPSSTPQRKETGNELGTIHRRSRPARYEVEEATSRRPNL